MAPKEDQQQQQELALQFEAAVFQHPAAQRSTVLVGHRVGYALRRARRRSIGFVVGSDGLVVSAPRWVGLADIETALQAKAEWIVRKLHEQRERAQRLAAARIDWRDGAELPFLGRPIRLRLGAAVMAFDAATAVLHLALPHNAAPAQLRDAAQSWLRAQARRVFEERCAVLAPLLAVQVRRLSLSSAATRWGSASADRSIRLHWRLVHFALPVIDYVVTHELAHLREMNHSPRFWDTVRSVLPDYDDARRILKDETLPVF